MLHEIKILLYPLEKFYVCNKRYYLLYLKVNELVFLEKLMSLLGQLSSPVPALMAF